MDFDDTRPVEEPRLVKSGRRLLLYAPPHSVKEGEVVTQLLHPRTKNFCKVEAVQLVNEANPEAACDVWGVNIISDPPAETEQQPKENGQPSLLGGTQPARATGRPEDAGEPSGDAREHGAQVASEPGRQPEGAPEEKPATKKKVAKKATRKKQTAKAEPEAKEAEVIVDGQVHAIIPAGFKKAPAAAQKAAKNLAVVIQESAPVIQALIPPGLAIDKLHAVTGAALMSRNAEKLAQCSRMSLLQALTRCATDGLVPDGTEAYIVPMPDPRGGPDLATYIAKAQGVISAFAREGIVHPHQPCQAFEVYEGDYFRYDSFTGLEEHVPWALRPTKGDTDRNIPARPKEKGEKLGWLVRWKFPDDNYMDTFVEMADILKRRDMSPMYRSTKSRQHSPWVKWEKEMQWKTAVRLSAKPIPKPTALSRLLERDNEPGGVDDPALLVTADSEQKQLPAGQGALDTFAGGAG